MTRLHRAGTINPSGITRMLTTSIDRGPFSHEEAIEVGNSRPKAAYERVSAYIKRVLGSFGVHPVKSIYNSQEPILPNIIRFGNVGDHVDDLGPEGELFALLVLQAGKARISTMRDSLVVQRGDFIILPPKTTHWAEYAKGPRTKALCWSVKKSPA